MQNLQIPIILAEENLAKAFSIVIIPTRFNFSNPQLFDPLKTKNAVKLKKYMRKYKSSRVE